MLILNSAPPVADELRKLMTDVNVPLPTSLSTFAHVGARAKVDSLPKFFEVRRQGPIEVADPPSEATLGMTITPHIRYIVFV